MPGEELSGEALGLGNILIRPLINRVSRELEQRQVDGLCRNGAVRVTLRGDQRVIGVSITPGDGGGNQALLEKMVAEAVADALQKTHRLLKEEIRKVKGSLPIPIPDDLLE